MLKEMWGEEVPRNYDAPEPVDVGSPIHIWKTDTGTPDPVINVIHNIVKSIHMKLGQQAQPLNYIRLTHNINGWLLQNPHTDDKWILYGVQGRWWIPNDEGGGMQLVPLDFKKAEEIIRSWV